MFGYIVFNQDELKFKEYKLYRSYYCGLCRTLKKDYGISGQLTLSYDTTFLALFLSSLYEPEDRESEVRCLMHPVDKHPTRTNEYVSYAAAMNILLSYYSCQDDWSDEHSTRKLLLSKALSGKQAAVCAAYPEKAEVIRSSLESLHRAEAENDTDLDKVSGYFGELMAEVFAMKQDEWTPVLKRMGFYLGKFMYILDAFDDLEKDYTNHCYNPFIVRKEGEVPEKPWKKDGFTEECRLILTMMMAEVCKCFELLPILNHLEILRNILYSGVWSKFEEACERRRKSEETEN